MIKTVNLIRAALRGWLLPLLLVPAGSIAQRSLFISRLAVRMTGLSTTLMVRETGIRVRTPLLDAWPAFEVFALGEYDFPQISWRQVRTVIDCGAHVGSFALWVAKKAPCQIIAVEPNPAAYGLLIENVAPLGDRVTVVRKAVAAGEGERELWDMGFPGGASLAPARQQIRRVPVQTIELDKLMDEHALPRVDLLKMDVEGAEREIFSAASQKTLMRIERAIIECHPSAGSDAEFIEAKLRHAGMKVVCADERLVLAWRE